MDKAVDRQARRWGAGVLLAGLALTWAGVAYYQQTWEALCQARFVAFVDHSAAQVRDRVLFYERGLRGTRSAMLAAGPTQMSLERFRLVSQFRDPMTEFPGVRGFGFIQRVAPADEAEFLAEVARQGREGFQIRALSQHGGERFIIKYIEPEALNRAAVGLDIGSEANRRGAMVQAMRSGEATLTAPITLVQADGKKGQGFLLLLPVYGHYPIPVSAAEREKAALGATYCPLVIEEVLATNNPLAEGVAVTLYDQDGNGRLIPFYGQSAAVETQVAWQATRRFDLFGRTWMAEYRATPEYLKTLPPNLGPLVALVGCIVSLLSALTVLREMQGRGRLQVMQRRLATFIERAPTALAMFDQDMCYLAVSERWLDDYSLRGRDIVGKSHYELHPNLPASWREAHRRALRGEELRSDNERFERADGSVLWLHWAIRPWYNEAGDIGGVVIFTEDVTERHRMMTDLEAAKEEAEKADRAKTLFLGNMSHELRTPVHQLSGLLALLQRDALSERQLRHVEMMGRSIQRLDTVIGGILTLVDLEANTADLHIVPLDLGELCRSMVLVLEERAREKNLALILDMDHLGSGLCGDGRHIRTILACYINNAITFSEHGTVSVALSRVKEDASSVLVRIAVADQGVGIAPEKLGQIFREFEQVDNSRTRRYGGTGVGLAIVRRLAKLMGGEAGCESQPGQGSLFWVTIPLLKSEALSLGGKVDDYVI